MALTRDIAAINTIIIHCAATPTGKPFFAQDIDRWHEQRGFHRAAPIAKSFNHPLVAIGYHFVIDLNGKVETGRHLTEVGAHAINHNRFSVGICLIGTDKFTPEQWDALRTLVSGLQQQIPNIQKIIGHYQVQPNKTCPCFDVPAWLADDMQPTAAHIL